MGLSVTVVQGPFGCSLCHVGSSFQLERVFSGKEEKNEVWKGQVHCALFGQFGRQEINWFEDSVLLLQKL